MALRRGGCRIKRIFRSLGRVDVKVVNSGGEVLQSREDDGVVRVFVESEGVLHSAEDCVFYFRGGLLRPEDYFKDEIKDCRVE